MSKSRYEDEYREANHAIGWGWGVVIISIIMVCLISAALWFTGVMTSDVRGMGEAKKQKNDGGNRISAQEAFQDRYNELLAADRRIDTFSAALKRDPDDKTARTNYDGAVNYCLGLVGRYNADTEKYTKEEFRDASLPEKIDITNPQTDCKEN